MTTSNHILHHIEHFTSQRDKELLAFSLLKSIQSMFSPHDASIVNFNHRDEPISQIAMVSDTYQYKYKNIYIPDVVKSAVEYMHNWTLDEHVSTEGTTYYYCHLLKQSRQQSQFLVMALDKKLNKSEVYIIKGMLSIYNNFSNLLSESQTDELTGLMNRKTFDESIVKLYHHFRDTPELENDNQSHTWLAIIDIDLFKQINDRFGHLYGDEILIHMARTLQQSFLPTDLLFRFGGEEFVAVLKNKTKAECEQTLEALREAVQRIEVNDGRMLSVSVGATKFDNKVFHITLLDHADKALYFSKDHGRNRITFYEDMISGGLVQEEELESGDIDLF